MKIVSWNVNGVRAIVKKGFLDQLKMLDADVLCLQETKAQNDQVVEVLAESGYHIYPNHAIKKGYSSTAILTKVEPIKVWNDLNAEEHDGEGRVGTAEFENFFLVNTYVPNSKGDLSRLKYRKTWDAHLLGYLKELEKTKPVFLCGDLNVAHRDIDIANPKSNYNKSPGYTQDEIDGIDNYINSGLTDTFRHFYPDTVKYSWWSFRAGARARNVGWRLDYFLASKGVMTHVKDAFILNDYEGSDHCPVGIEVEF